jgi:hypothetical protein
MVGVADVSAFMTRLSVEEEDEQRGLWRLGHPLVYQSDLLGKTITVPAGFVTDFASIPRLPIVYLAVGGRGDRAAVAHDWLYSSQAVDRATADAILREALLATGYGSLLANMFYAAVRLFGASHWSAPNVPQTASVSAQMQAA